MTKAGSAIAMVLVGCEATPEPTPTAQTCAAAVVTDIDETLTTSDGEFISQLLDATHDPAMRPDANTLMQGYADHGFTIFYVTARGADLTLTDGRPAQQATEDWLDLHGFPRSEGDVFLAEGLAAVGAEAADYKDEVVTELGTRFDLSWGYGNATTDIAGFQGGGVPETRLFLVGELAGTLGVTGIPDEEAFTAHLRHLDTVTDPCDIP